MSIRCATKQDVPAMLAVYRPYIEQTAITFEYEVPTPEEFTRRFESISEACPWLVWEENGEILGYAYGAPAFERKAYAWCADLSVYLKKEAWGRGIGRALYTELETVLQAQGYRVLYALVTSANAPSVAFHKALGYRETANFPHCGYKLGQWYGVMWLEKDVGDFTKPEDFPIPFSVLRETMRTKPN